MLLEILKHFLNFFTDFQLLFTAIWSMTLGIIMGALPGLSGPMAMALLVGVTYTMRPEVAVVSLTLIYVGGVYGGSQSAILINIPGAAASAATVLDGYPLTCKGQAGAAIVASAGASTVGTFIGLLFLIFLAPLLIKVSLLFATWEFALLAIFGVLISGTLTSPSQPIKGWISGFLGLLIAMIGMEELYAYQRFAFGNIYLGAGVPLIPALVGLFGITEVFLVMGPKGCKHTHKTTLAMNITSELKKLPRHWKVMIQSGVIGTIMGIIPGVGADIGAWVSYDMAKRTSKHPEDYGKGSIEGVIASETGNNAVPPTSIIPVMALGIPGSSGAAIIMAALFLQGLKPGPLFLLENSDLFYTLIGGVILGCILLPILGLSISKIMVNILKVPRETLMPTVVVLAVIGSYASNIRISNIWFMIAFGVLGYLLKKQDFPLPPMLLGIILGGILDGNLRRALLISCGSLTPFLTRTVSLILVIAIVVTILASQKIFITFLVKCFSVFNVSSPKSSKKI